MQENNVFPHYCAFSIKDEDDRKFAGLCEEVYRCGLLAKDNQKNVKTSVKSDGTPVTESDLAVSAALDSYISKSWPDCNRVSEEIKENVLDGSAKYTFIFDPIDGTSSYSQGMPSWCIGVGVLDSSRKPCASVLFAPRMGIGEEDLFVCTSFNDSSVYLNGRLLSVPEHLEKPRYIATGSNSFMQVDFSQYRGKIRSWGSSLLHLLGPCIWNNTDACITPKCYAWDICSSHTFASKLGLVTKYIDGADFEYTDSILSDRSKIRCPLVCAQKECADWVVEHFREI